MSFEITGLKKLDKALEKLEKKDLNKIVKKGLKAGMKIIQKQVKQNMPVDSGDAKKNIVVRATPRKFMKKGETGQWCGNTREKFLAKTSREFYLPFIEYGNSNNTPSAPFRRALDAKAGAAKQEMIDTIAKELNAYKGKR